MANPPLVRNPGLSMPSVGPCETRKETIQDYLSRTSSTIIVLQELVAKLKNKLLPVLALSDTENLPVKDDSGSKKPQSSCSIISELEKQNDELLHLGNEINIICEIARL